VERVDGTTREEVGCVEYDADMKQVAVLFSMCLVLGPWTCTVL
jgi:hypothetical protein